MCEWLYSDWWTADRVLMAYYVYNSAVQAMPAPEPGERWYLLLYRLAHAGAANWGLTGKAPKVKYQ